MGYVTAVAGTTITASSHNSEVRDQVISVFASTSARDSAITSPVAGMHCHTTDHKFNWFYTNSTWRLVGGQTIYYKVDTSTSFLSNVSGSQTVLTTSSITIEPSQAYKITAGVPIQNGGFTNGQGQLTLKISTDGGSTYGTQWNLGWRAFNAVNGPWDTGRAVIYKAGVETSLVLQLVTNVSGGTYDVLGSSTNPVILIVESTGKLSTEGS